MILRRLFSHQPLTLWVLASVLLAMVLSFNPPSMFEGVASVQEASETRVHVANLRNAMLPPPVGYGDEETRAWAESARSLAIVGAEAALAESDSAAASLWSILLQVLSNMVSEELEDRERMSLTSDAVNALYDIESYYASK